MIRDWVTGATTPAISQHSLPAANLSRLDTEHLAVDKSNSAVNYHINLPCGHQRTIKKEVSGASIPDGIDLAIARGFAFGHHSSKLPNFSRGSEHYSLFHSLQTYH